MPGTSVSAQLKIGSGLSGHLDAAMAAEYAAGRCAESLGGATPDLVFCFFSAHHVESAANIAEAVRKRLSPRCLIGCSAEAVIGGEIEMEGAPGVSLMGAVLPGVAVHPFFTDEIPIALKPKAAEEGAAQVAGFGPEHRATFLLCDPFSVPLNALLPIMCNARNLRAGGKPGERRPGPIIGGMCSAASKPEGNVLFLNERTLRSGGVGVGLSGPLRVDTLVSQGCRPIGPTMVITGCKGQMITTLGGRPAMEVLSEVLDSLSEEGKQRLRRGLFIGRAISEYKERFGRDDFLIRNVIGVERERGAIAVADLLRVGQTIQFHVRDAATAGEDLGLLLDVQKLYEPPAGVLLFTCNGRGARLFDRPHHDAAAFARAFAPPLSAEEQAKAGVPLTGSKTAGGKPGAGGVPLCGLFCAGEIGPVGEESFVHGQTACAALFRAEPGAAGR